MNAPTEQGLPAARGFWVYVYSNANVWGSLAGLGGVAMMFAGLIGPGWLAIVAGLYGIGALAAPKPRAPDFHAPAGLNEEAVARHLDEVIAAAKGANANEASELLVSIKAQVLSLLPKLDSPALTEEDRFILRETLGRYLPDTLANYLKLPPLYRHYHVVRDGKTAERLLREQVAVIDTQMKSMVERVFRAEAQGMLAHGRFLEDKFQKTDLIQALSSGGKT